MPSQTKTWNDPSNTPEMLDVFSRLNQHLRRGREAARRLHRRNMWFVAGGRYRSGMHINGTMTGASGLQNKKIVAIEGAKSHTQAAGRRYFTLVLCAGGPLERVR